jgi:hypothetical protein
MWEAQDQGDPRPPAPDLVKALEGLRRSHLEVEDGYYSCPLMENYFGPEEGETCNCGADKHNAKLDAIIAALAGGKPNEGKARPKDGAV